MDSNLSILLPVQADEPTSEPQITRSDSPLPFVRAQWNFTGRSSSELDLQKGDKIEVIEEHESGMWYGRIGTKRGWFPTNHCTPIIIGYARVLTEHLTNGSQELDLYQGDLVEIHNKDSPSYWYGSKGGFTGWFDSSHCDIIEEDDRNDADTPDGSEIGDESDIERWEDEAYRAGVWL